jgi:N-acetylglucosaminyldiphosphoundecaprenol N-acetyl-beta-D-mannosaminyltransferase
LSSFENTMYLEVPEAPVPRRTNVLGVGISAIDMNDALRLSDALIQAEEKGYVCVTGVHGVIEAQSDPEFRGILNRSLMTTPDGMPMVWIGRMRGFSNMRRVYGPDFMMNLCRLSVARGYRHFLYGGGPGVAVELAEALSRRCPGLQIAGTYTPPFRPLNEAEEAELISLVAEAKPDVFWVGLSTPKQERFMNQNLDKLNVRLMVGVGAAFDIHTGAIKDAPHLVKNLGLQWLHRLVQEPRRLWRRYLINNPKFIWKTGLQFLGLRKFPMEVSGSPYDALPRTMHVRDSGPLNERIQGPL